MKASYLCAVVVALAGIASSRADVVAGSPGDSFTGDCAPFGCVIRYQQLYSSSLFSGPITITGLTFYNTKWSPGSVAGANYTIDLSTTTQPVNGLSSTFADNVGADNHVFFNGPLGGPIAGGQFTITGTPFTYNPAAGNLLMDVSKNGGNYDFSAFLDARIGDFSGFTRVYDFASMTSGSVNDNYGLVTGFVTGPSAVPEPGSLMLLGSGLVGLGLVARRRAVSRTRA